MSEDTRRISKVIARSGLASRREAESIVEAGRVKVNGEKVHHPGHPVTAKDRITVDDLPLPSLASSVRCSRPSACGRSKPHMNARPAAEPRRPPKIVVPRDQVESRDLPSQRLPGRAK